MELSIVIVSYNVKEFLEQCIVSVLNSIQHAEIIVVDNNSSDGTLQMLERKYPMVRLIANSENVGFSKANNQGIEVAESGNILLLNPDTCVVGDALKRMLQFLNAQNQLCIVGPKLVNEDKTPQISCWEFPSLTELIAETFYMHRVFNVTHYSKHKLKSVLEVDSLSGAALMFKKALVDKIGLLDDNLFWMEDIDFCYRAKNVGARIIYFPDAEIIHFSGQSSKKNYSVAISNQLMSKLKFQKKHHGRVSFYVASIFTLIHIVSRIVFFLLLSPFKDLYGRKRVAYFYTLTRFIKYIFKGDTRIA